MLGHSTSLPVETNSISLDPTVKDAWGLPALRLTFKEHPNDHRLSEFLRTRAIDLIQAAGAVEYWPYAAGPSPFPQVHLLGTCRMGNGAMAVVDEHLRVHGMGGLRIADASVMPTIISGNTSIPCMMIGEKCAEMVLSDAAQD